MSPRPEWYQMILDGTLVGTERAAILCGVTEATVRQWVLRRHLRPQNPGQSPALYLASDVDRCDEERLAEKRLQRPRVLQLAG